MAAQASETVEEIIVTGSRIPRNRDFETTSPITTLDSVEFRLSGTTNIEDSLDALPQVVPGFNRSANNPGTGQSSVNLRGLGVQRTIVLLNGRRFISSNPFGSADINNIPPALIDRTEVVTGGASAVYGSDAIAGAVNFILKDSFEGLEASVQYDITDRNDGQVIDATLAGGMSFAGGRGQLSGFLGYNDRHSILQGDREHSAQTRATDFNTGEEFIGGSPANPEGSIPNPVMIGNVNAPDGITFNQDGTPRPFTNDDFYDFAPINYLQTPLTRGTAAVLADLDVGASSNIFVELMYVDNVSGSQLAPAPVFFLVDVNIDNPFVQPETRQVFEDFLDPDGDGIARFLFRKRLTDLGPRIFESDSRMSRAVLGAEGEFSNGWSWEVHYQFSDVNFDNTISNVGSVAKFRQALLVDPATGQCFDSSGGCVPANVFGANNMSEAAVEFISVPPVVETTSNDMSIFHASTVGEIPIPVLDTLYFAIGAEYRSDSVAFFAPPEFEGGTIGQFPSPPISGEFSMRELFGELIIPVLSGRRFARKLELELGYRWTDHSISGIYDSWKVASLWEPVDGLMLRASLQEAVRAPNGEEFFEGAFSGEVTFLWEVDLCSASLDPEALGVTDVCLSQGIPQDQIGIYEATPFFIAQFEEGGNLGLEPEVSDTLTAGIVYQPAWAPDLQVSLDYYSIQIDNAIQSLGPFDTVFECFSLNDPASDLCQAIERNDPNFNITSVKAGPRNIARIETEGIDLQLQYTFDLPSAISLFDGASDLRIWFLGNHALKNGTQTAPSAPFLDCVDGFGFPCDLNSFGTLPEYKTKTRLTYSSGPLSLSLQWRWIAGMDNSCAKYCAGLFGLPDGTFQFAVPEIDSENYYALSFDWSFNDSISLYGGVKNLTDNDPPWLGGIFVQANTDPSIFDPYGRRYYLGMTARFGQD